MNITIEPYIGSELLKKPRAYKRIVQILQASSGIVAGEYKKQMPVDKGAMRNNVYISNNADGYRVTTPMSYAKFVHEGTGRYRGQPDAGYHRGRVRQANWYGVGGRSITEKRRAIAGMMYQLWRTGKFKGQKPNKFADRTTKITAPKVATFFVNKLKPLLK